MQAGRQEFPALRPQSPQSGAAPRTKSTCGLQSASAPGRVAALPSARAQLPGTQAPHSANPTPTAPSAAPKARESEPPKCGAGCKAKPAGAPDRTPAACPRRSPARSTLLAPSPAPILARASVRYARDNVPAAGECRSASAVSAYDEYTHRQSGRLHSGCAARAALYLPGCRSASPPDTSSRAAKREGNRFAPRLSWEFRKESSMRRGSGPRMVQFWIEYSSGGSTVPLYEYQCTKCNKRTEKIESVAGPHLKKCPHCGGKVERLQSAPAIQFKGSGWYVTDYDARKSGSDSAAAEKTDSKGTSKESASKESASKDSAAKDSKEKKPANTKD